MPLNKDLYLGFDGGGTKTICVLGDADGHILASAAGPSTNLKSRPPEHVKQTIADLLAQVLTDVDTVKVKSVYVSTAGGDRPEDQSRWKNWILDYGLNPAYLVVENDATGALAAGTGTKNGTVLIAGTGSIAYSIRDDLAKPIRAGGWGYLFGDEGSGYDIGTQALKKLARSHDGREAQNQEFTDYILEQLGLNSPEQLITFIYENSYPRKVIASIAKYTIELAEQGNEPAQELIRDASHSLAELVLSIYHRDRNSAELPLVASGGLFKSNFFKKQFEAVMRARDFKQSIIVPEYPPVIGSYICSLIQDGKVLTNELKQNLYNSWDNAL